ncbi:hypothetical protein C0J52_03269 [Blattella germanica]|nr:hypothetical protein C0J52_03269 [Blattella germanica]
MKLVVVLCLLLLAQSAHSFSLYFFDLPKRCEDGYRLDRTGRCRKVFHRVPGVSHNPREDGDQVR